MRTLCICSTRECHSTILHETLQALRSSCVRFLLVLRDVAWHQSWLMLGSAENSEEKFQLCLMTTQFLASSYTIYSTF